MASNPARIGVVGCGWWATGVHLPALLGHAGAVVVGVADADQRRAETTAAAFGIDRAFSDYRDLLGENIDGIVVATPHNTHYAVARDALEARADVLVEKPLTVLPEDARALVDRARAVNQRLHVGYTFPFTRHAQELKRLIAAGDLGRITSVSALFATAAGALYTGNPVSSESTALPDALWPPGIDTYSSQARGGGQLLTQTTHAASLIFFLTEVRPNSVLAHIGGDVPDVDVWNAISFQTETGAVGSISSTGSISRHEDRREEYRIFGTAGQAALDTHNGTLTVINAAGKQHVSEPLSPTEIYPASATAGRLVDCINGSAEVLVTGELGALTVEFLAAARESATTGLPSPVERNSQPDSIKAPRTGGHEMRSTE